MEAETAFPGATKFETFILLLRLIFELQLVFKPPIGISLFGLETRISRPIAPKFRTKNDPYVLRPSSKFQVSILSRFEVIAFSISGYRNRNFARKNMGTPDAKRRVSLSNEKKSRNPEISIKKLTKKYISLWHFLFGNNFDINVPLTAVTVPGPNENFSVD